MEKQNPMNKIKFKMKIIIKNQRILNILNQQPDKIKMSQEKIMIK